MLKVELKQQRTEKQINILNKPDIEQCTKETLNKVTNLIYSPDPARGSKNISDSNTKLEIE